MLKKIQLILLLTCFSFFCKAQSVTITSMTAPIETGNTFTVNYTYTSSASSNYLYAGILLYNGNTEDSFIVGGESAGNIAGTDVPGSITFTIPSGTTLSADLTAPFNYKIKIDMSDTSSGFVYLAGAYPSTPLDIVAGAPANGISFESPTLTKALIGNTIQVDYKFTSAVDVSIYCAINSYDGSGTRIFPAVADGFLSPVSAGTDVLGSFSLIIPSGTTKTSDLAIGFSYKIFIQIVAASDGSFISGAYPSDAINITDITNWTGNTNSDWATKSNWDIDVPNSVSIVNIPASKSVVISSTTGANSNNITVDATSTLSVNAGGSLKVEGTSTGNITYNVNVADTNWHLIASPLVGVAYNDTWVTNNDIASGVEFGTNRAISTYDNTSFTNPSIVGEGGHWRYHQATTSGIFGTGIGYSLKKDVVPGVSASSYNFTGTMPTTVTPTISQGINNWNLVGNSFPSYMDVAAFLTVNGTSGTNQLSDAFQAIYVWDGTSYNDITTGYIQPGQAFFVNSRVNPGTVAITKAMQSHQTGVSFYKSNQITLNLSVSNGTITKTTQINYLDDKTKGLDPGFDIGMFDGVPSDLRIYTHLVENNEGIAFAKQALPTSEINSIIIPIGLKAEAGKEITFSVESLNLPSGVNVYIEDRTTNTFTSLTNANLSIVLNTSLNGVGKYYIHLSNSSLSTDNNFLESVSVFTSKNANLKVIGLPRKSTSLKLFNILGKQVFNATYISIGSDNISLPKLSKGIYIVQIASENRNLNKKIILE